jgi:hypothetical protein
MKKLTHLLTIGIAGWLLQCAMPVRAELEVSASVRIHAIADFDAPLSACGSWVEVGSYGRCWRPDGVVVGWRPYCNGYWVWTDYGWYWVSDEPWAWACYHYGFWVYDSIYGWIWVPGRDWAPAWVCWRFGGGYIGWAPMPPPGRFFRHQPADSAFVFVDDDHFSHRITSTTVAVNRPAIIRKTKFVRGTERATRDFSGAGRRKVFINEGPGLAAMEKATGRRFTAISVRDADRRTPLPPSFRHSTVPTEIKHEQQTLAPPDHNSPGGNGKEGGSVAPSRKVRPNHGKVPTGHSDAPSGSGRDQGDGHGHGQDHD